MQIWSEDMKGADIYQCDDAGGDIFHVTDENVFLVQTEW